MQVRSAPAGRPSGRRLRRVAAVAVAGVLLSVTAACGSTAGWETRAVAESSTPAPPPPPPAPVLWPLTGIDSAGADLNRPALAVKVENSIDARPQTGLNAADMVWEEMVEGGISRFVAVYHSTVPPVIGPVRSVRPMDPGIAAPLHGLLAFSGGQAPFVDAVWGAGLQVLSADAGAAGFYRVDDRSAPHNTYVDPAALLGQADDGHRAPPPAQFVTGAAPTAPAVGSPAGVLNLALSRVAQPSWSWSPADGVWLRSEGTTPAVEADGAPIRAVNVVVLRVDVVNTSFTDPANNPVPETVMVGGGEALVGTGGHAVAATWSKASVGEPVVLTLPDGSPVVLAPGSTWVELVPNSTGSVAVS